MSVDTFIKDGDGSSLRAHVHRLAGAPNHVGIVTLQERFLQFKPEVHPFLNDTFGTAMNQNVSFSGTPEIIHNGGTSTEWTGSSLQGTWNFADSAKVSLTSANNNDAATFAEENTTTIDTSGYTTLTGKINLTIYNDANNNISVIFDLTGASVGSSVFIDDYIDTGLIGTEQAFVIPKEDLGISTQLVDGFTITVSRIGGTKPTMTFDNIQLEQTGASAVFRVTTPTGTKFHITEIRIAIADNIDGVITVAGATENASMIGLSYNQILGVSALTNGIIFSRVHDGVTQFSVLIKQLGDFLGTGSNLANAISDGTNTFIVLQIDFPEPIVVNGTPDSFLSFTISDNLSGLLQLTAAARGAVEI